MKSESICIYQLLNSFFSCDNFIKTFKTKKVLKNEICIISKDILKWQITRRYSVTNTLNVTTARSWLRTTVPTQDYCRPTTEIKEMTNYPTSFVVTLIFAIDL